MTGVEIDIERAANQWDSWQKLTQVEGDRFCDGCAYNMRLQLVRREPTTGIPMCRCPECGRFHSVASSEKPIRQLITRLPLLWAMLSLVFTATLFLSVGFGLFLIHMGTIETVWTYRQVASVRSPYGYSYLQPIQDLGEEEFFVLNLLAGLSVFTAAVGGALAAVHLFHWSRRRTFFVWLMPSILVAVFVMLILRSEGPGSAGGTSFVAGAGYVLFQFLFQVAGLLTGVLTGRATARFVVRYMLPPSLRPPMSFLWTCDGLVQPRFKDDTSPGPSSATME